MTARNQKWLLLCTDQNRMCRSEPHVRFYLPTVFCYPASDCPCDSRRTLASYERWSCLDYYLLLAKLLHKHILLTLQHSVFLRRCSSYQQTRARLLPFSCITLDESFASEARFCPLKSASQHTRHVVFRYVIRSHWPIAIITYATVICWWSPHHLSFIIVENNACHCAHVPAWSADLTRTLNRLSGILRDVSLLRMGRAHTLRLLCWPLFSVNISFAAITPTASERLCFSIEWTRKTNKTNGSTTTTTAPNFLQK